MRFNPLEYPIIYTPPRRLRQATWQPHIPFAMFLIAALKPKLLVELGVLSGDSYCAFCQAVQTLRLETRCYGVDTWQGDPHAGEYGPEILAELRAHHNPLYSGFSTLVQRTFDDALGSFENGSIDLLHIDGYHTYEAVKHDFESWLPKTSGRAVVLFHDVNVHREDFGVWRLWEEIAPRYPSFMFKHAFGLGIVAVGKQVPASLRPLLEAPPAAAEVIRSHFQAVGERLLSFGLSIRASALAGDLKRWEEAAAYLQAMVEAYPKAENVKLMFASCLANAGRRQQAQDLLVGIVAARPADLDARLLLVDVLLADGKADQAIAVLGPAVEGDQPSGKAYHKLGAALRALGRHADAAAAFERALQLGNRPA